MKIAVILPAAGVSRRFNAEGGGGNGSKLEMDLGGKPVFMRAVELFLGRSDVVQVILAVNPDQFDAFSFRYGDKLRFLSVDLVPGGTIERWETVSKALATVTAECTHIAVHDAARPLASATLIDRVFEAAGQYDAVVPGIAEPNTLKRVVACDTAQTEAHDPLDAILGNAGKPKVYVQRVVETVDRSQLVAVQTPQVFSRSLLERAYAQIAQGKLNASGITDDASLVEAMGEPVYVVEGEAMNFKITRPDDAELAQAVVARRDATTAAEFGRKRLFGDEDE